MDGREGRKIRLLLKRERGREMCLHCSLELKVLITSPENWLGGFIVRVSTINQHPVPFDPLRCWTGDVKSSKVHDLKKVNKIVTLVTHRHFLSILLTHEGSHREVDRDFQPSLTSSAGGAKGLSDHRFRAPPAYIAQLLTLHRHRVNNQYRTANQI